MSGDGAVEWGEGRPVRWFDRLFGDFGGGGPGLSAPAVSAAIVGAALFAAAEVLPWMTVEQVVQPGVRAQSRDVSLEGVGWGVTAAYYLGVMVLLAVAGLAQVSRPHTRRALTAAGFGLAAGMVVLLIGIVRRAGEGGQFGMFDQLSTTATVGSAPYVAIVGVLFALAALVITGWRPNAPVRRRQEPVANDGSDDEEPGPIDLTVTPA